MAVYKLVFLVISISFQAVFDLKNVPSSPLSQSQACLWILSTEEYQFFPVWRGTNAKNWIKFKTRRRACTPHTWRMAALSPLCPLRVYNYPFAGSHSCLWIVSFPVLGVPKNWTKLKKKRQPVRTPHMTFWCTITPHTQISAPSPSWPPRAHNQPYAGSGHKSNHLFPILRVSNANKN